jgi:hypothetical protein
LEESVGIKFFPPLGAFSYSSFLSKTEEPCSPGASFTMLTKRKSLVFAKILIEIYHTQREFSINILI